MKTIFPIALLCALTISPDADAALVESGTQNIPIPFNFEGLYLRIDTGVTTTIEPGDFDTAPWINLFMGGVFIGNSPLLPPIVTGTEQILNLAAGTEINGTGNFVAGQSGSSTHVGSGAGLFQLGTPGLIGFSFNPVNGGPDYYGWLAININNTGAGTLIDWAYDDSPGTAITAGSLPSIPEPNTVLFGWATLLAALGRRKRAGSTTRDAAPR